MSWWAYLQSPDDGETMLVGKHAEGGTYRLGGVNEAELNVTYNYGKPFREVWPEERDWSRGTLGGMLNGRVAEETIKPLSVAVEALGKERSSDYWEPSPGNAGYALSILLAWAAQHPEGVWHIS